MRESRFKDKVALVTGAGGIGAELVKQLLEEGAKVVIADIREELSRKVADEYDPGGKNTLPLSCDVSNEEDVKEMVNQAVERFETIDILINGAGITRDAISYKMTTEQWKQVIEVNLSGIFNVSREVIPYMKEQKYGKIVNISSTSAHGNVGQINYSAAKAGVVGITKTLAKELGRYNINVNAVSPGPTKTEMLESVPEKIIKKFVEATALGRLGLPEDQANVICFLASDEASYITGVELLVCGGFLIT